MNKILNHDQISQKITRIAHEIIENTTEVDALFIAGICGNGLLIAEQIGKIIQENSDLKLTIFEIKLDKDEPLNGVISSSIDIKNIKDSFVILIDDVVNSGKTMQYALTKILEQNTRNIKTAALVDRTHRRFPVKCDFVGLTLSTTLRDRVEVELSEKESFAHLV